MHRTEYDLPLAEVNTRERLMQGPKQVVTYVPTEGKEQQTPKVFISFGQQGPFLCDELKSPFT